MHDNRGVLQTMVELPEIPDNLLNLRERLHEIIHKQECGAKTYSLEELDHSLKELLYSK